MMDGRRYVLEKLPPLAAFHLARKIMPVMWRMATIKEQSVVDPPPNFKLALALEGMDDAAVDAILHPCLARIKEHLGTALAPIFVPGGGLMNSTLTGNQLGHLAIQFIDYNLSDFFRFRAQRTSTDAGRRLYYREDITGAPTAQGIADITMADGEDWLFRPVVRGVMKGESLLDSSIDLTFIALCNEALDAQDLRTNALRAWELQQNGNGK